MFMVYALCRVSVHVLSMLAFLLLSGCGEDRSPLFPRQDRLLGADIERGRQLISHYGCVACHTVPGIRGPTATVGPSLEKIGLRAYLGGVLPNTPTNLLRWLRDPPAIDPRTAMPNMGLNDAEAKDIAAYLLTLH